MKTPKDKDIAIVNLPVKVIFHSSEYGMLMQVIGGECVFYDEESAKRVIEFSEEVLYSGDSGESEQLKKAFKGYIKRKHTKPKAKKKPKPTLFKKKTHETIQRLKGKA